MVRSAAWMFALDGLPIEDIPRPVLIHPLIQKIKAGVILYRAKSLSHFALHIDVQPDDTERFKAPDFNDRTNLKVVFANWGTEVRKICRAVRSKNGKATSEVQVREKNGWVSLEKSLEMYFHPDTAIVTEAIVQEWREASGMAFNWTGLPTELKGHVLQFCVGQPHRYYDGHYKSKDRVRLRGRKPRALEIVVQLGDWQSLLRVSRQVRALILRLCTVHNDLYPGGLTIASHSYREFTCAIFRLRKCPQLIEKDSLRHNRKDQILAKRFLHYPKIYPELSRYATIGHGIRKLYLSFNFMDALHFWKVSVGELSKYRDQFYSVTSDVFDQLPHLNGIYVALPREWWQDEIRQKGPKLFHETLPCPRTLHRYIFERVAEAVAPYKNVRISFFLDLEEEQNFWNLYETAVLSLKFTEAELEELYRDVEGGILLGIDSDSTDMNTVAAEPMKSSVPSQYSGSVEDTDTDTFPPRCSCPVLCRDTFQNVGRY